MQTDILKETHTGVDVSALAAKLAQAPQLLNQLHENPHYVLAVPQALAEKVASGELEFMRKRESGALLGTLVDSETKALVAQVPLQEIPGDLVTTLLEAGIGAKLAEVTNQLAALEHTVLADTGSRSIAAQGDVIHAAQEKVRLAKICQAPANQAGILRDALSEVTTAKQQCLRSLREHQNQLEENRQKHKWASVQAVSETDLVNGALTSLKHLLAAIDCQMACLAGLHEYAAVDAVATDLRILLATTLGDADELLAASSAKLNTASSIVQDATAGVDALHAFLAGNAIRQQ